MWRADGIIPVRPEPRRGGAVSLAEIAREPLLAISAVLVTLTTKLSDMIDVLERALRPLRHVGVSPSKTGMMLSMVVRFIPLMMREAREILEA